MSENTIRFGIFNNPNLVFKTYSSNNNIKKKKKKKLASEKRGKRNPSGHALA